MVAIVGVDQSAIKRVTCKKCASILEYRPLEVKSDRVYDYGGGSDMVYSIKCPKCWGDVFVDRP